ncbi:MAG TPA: MATE family efflux transporter [Clostridiales bacterium]|nr:MATE family efflux transporter [Clostridiales bacterium]
MAVPTIISMLITTIYSLADTYFVSSLGTAATAAVGVNFSLDNLIMTFGSFLAVGANSYIARLLGAKEDAKASQVLSTSFFAAIMTGLLATAAGLLFLDPLVAALGAKDDVVQYAKDYAGYVLLAAPFMTANFVMNQCLRSEGSAVYSMTGMISGAILNIGLDPLFIITFGWGVKGASAATAISKLVSFIILIIPYIRRRSLLHLSFRNIRFSRDIVSEVVKMGFPTAMRTGLTALSTLVMNNMAGLFSDSALAAISVANRIMMFPTAAVLGFGQGYQPVAGFNWGARRYDRVKKAFWFSSIVGTLGITVLSLIIIVYAGPIMQLFTTADAEMLVIGKLCIRLQCYVMPIHAWVIVVNMSYAGLGKARGAAILSIARSGLCFIPMIVLLPRLFGVDGLAGAQAAADVLSLLIALPLFIKLHKEINLLIGQQKRDEAGASPLQSGSCGSGSGRLFAAPVAGDQENGANDHHQAIEQQQDIEYAVADEMHGAVVIIDDQKSQHHDRDD